MIHDLNHTLKNPFLIPRNVNEKKNHIMERYIVETIYRLVQKLGSASSHIQALNILKDMFPETFHRSNCTLLKDLFLILKFNSNILASRLH